MTQKTILLVLFLNLLTLTSFSQGTSKNKNIRSIDTLKLSNQLDFIITNSNNYQNFKVIDKSWLNTLKSHLKDSVNTYRETIALKTKEITDLSTQTDNLNQEIETLKLKNAEKDSINILGLGIPKKTYHTIVWSLIGLLLALAGFFYYKFNTANIITKNTKQSYEELEHEYNQHRSRALEREQALNRKLIDAQKTNE